MAAPKQAARKPRRRDRKSVPVGQAHIRTGHPTVEDMITVGVKNKMKEKRCREIYEDCCTEVWAGV